MANLSNDYISTKNKRPTKTFNETTLKAQNIFLDMLPTSWRVEHNRLDYGVDYDISTETMFAINIKGTSKPKYSENNVLCLIETSKLEYYINRITKPVFIVLVDIVTKKAYWLFIQEYIENVLEENQPNWRCKKTINIKIPLSNTLQDFSSFNAATLRASNLIVLFQYKLPFLTVFNSLENAVNNCYHTEFHPSSCSSNSCSNTACSSCPSTDEMALSQELFIAGEKHYQDYVSSLSRQEHSHCIIATNHLMNIILRAIEEDKYFIAAELTLKLADIYFLAFTYLSKTLGANKAFSLMDLGETLLEKAHNLVTTIETPNRVLN